MQDVYKIIEEYNLGKKGTILTVFGDILLKWLVIKNLIQL